MRFKETVTRSPVGLLTSSQTFASITSGADGPELDALVAKYGCTDIQPVFRKYLYDNGTVHPLQDVAAVRATYMAASAGSVAAYTSRRARNQSSPRLPDLSSVYLIKFDVSKSVHQAAQDWASNSNVVYAEPNYSLELAALPNDPYLSTSGSWGQPYDDLWNMKKIGAPEAWPVAQGAGQVVAVVDTGIDLNHPDLAANIWLNEDEVTGDGLDNDGNGFVDDVHGYDFAGKDSVPQDEDVHGTHVAGTIAAVGDNSIGVIGVAPQSKVMAVRVLGDRAWIDTVAQGIVYAADNGADVINLSIGGLPLQSESDALAYAYSLGVIIVAAAGNGQIDALYGGPANHRDVITVGASTQDDQLAWYSNWGSKIDVVAPGGGTAEFSDVVDHLSTLSTQAPTDLRDAISGLIVGAEYLRYRGTSMASPMVAGAAAVILGLHPEFTQEQVRQALRISADDLGVTGYDLQFGHGRLNLGRAVALQSVPVAQIDTDPVAEFGSKTSAIPVFIEAGDARSIIGWQLRYSALDGTNSEILAQGTSTTPSRFEVPVDLSQVPFGEFLLTLTATQSDGLVARDDRRVANSIYASGSDARLPTAVGGWTALAKTADVNGDGLDDLFLSDPLLAGEQFLRSSTRLWFGQVGGGFREVSDDNLPLDHNTFGRVLDAAFADLDSDGDLDLVLSASSESVNGPDELRVWANDGEGVYTDRPDLLPSSLPPYAVAAYPTSPQVEVGDIDGDAFNDIVTTANGVRILKWSNSSGSFVDIDPAGRFPFGSFPISAMQLVDMDRVDGLDLVVFRSAASGAIGLNNGSGSFSLVGYGYFGTGGFDSSSLAITDLNHDLFPDIVGFELASSSPQVFLNQGNGSVVRKTNAFPSTSSFEPAYCLADISLDGIPDFISAVYSKALVGSGDGSFSSSPVPLISTKYVATSAQSPAVSLEATGDGYKDIVLPNFLSRFELLRGRWADLSLGDVNDDQSISVADIQRVTSHLSGGTQLTGQSLFRARVALGKPAVSKLDAYTLVDFVQDGFAELPVIFGDANRDGTVDDDDMEAVLLAASEPTSLDLDGRYRADVDSSGTITASDALSISRFINGTLAHLPQTRPVLDPIPDHRGSPGVQITFAVRAVDRDGDPVMFSVEGLPAGAQLSTTRRAMDDLAVFSWVPPTVPNGSAQSFPLIFHAADGQNETVESTTVTVVADGTCAGAADGTPCDDFEYCNGADTCYGGDCTAHAGSPCAGGICPQTCDEGLDRCDYPIGTFCDDGVRCTTGDLCVDGACVGAPVDCSASDTNCGIGVCRQSDGACILEPLPNGTACDDLSNRCTTGDACQSGVCGGGNPKDCSVLTTDCAIGACDRGECYQAEDTGAPCDNGLFCDGHDTCAYLSCQEHANDACMPDYWQTGSCSDFVCDEATDSCKFPAAGEFCYPDDDDCTRDQCDGQGGCHLPYCPTCPVEPLRETMCDDLLSVSLSFSSFPEAPQKNRLGFHSSGSVPIVREDLGDPVAGGTGYSLCLYSENGLVWESELESQQVCLSGEPCWSSNPTQVQYRDASRDPIQGIRAVQLRARDSGLRSRVSGAGSRLLVPDLISLASADVVIFQIVQTTGIADETRCWESFLQRPDRGDAYRYRAKSAD